MTKIMIPRSAVATWAMNAGNEEIYNIVIDDGRRKQWVSTEWVDLGVAIEADALLYPTVKDAA